VAAGMHCNLKPPDVAPVVLDFNYEAHNATAYQISTQSGNERPSHCWYFM